MSKQWVACGLVKGFMHPSLGFCHSKSILYTKGGQTCGSANLCMWLYFPRNYVFAYDFLFLLQNVEVL